MVRYWSAGTLPIKLLITWSALTSAYPECDVERHRPTLKQDREGIAFLHVTGQALEIHHRPHRLAVELFDDVAALDACLCGRATILDADHDHTVGRAQVELARDLGRHGANFEPEHRAGATAWPAWPLLLGLALVGRLANPNLDGLLALVTPDLDLRRAVRRGEADGALQVARPFHRAPLELDQDVAGLESGLCGRAVRNHFVDEHALRVLGAKRASQLRGERLDRYAEPSARHAALVAELRVDLPCHVGGNRKADARASGDDCRVDPDHLALHVHERSAGVARIDRGVRLKEVVERALVELSRLGADDAGRDRSLKAERGPDREDPVSDLTPVRVTQARVLEGPLPVVELEHGEVGLLVHPDDLGLVLSAIERHHFDLRGLLDHVRVRERDPRGIHDDAGTEAPLRDAFGYLAEEAPEELLPEELLERGAALEAGPSREGVDVDHGGLDRVRDPGERPALRHLDREEGQRTGGRLRQHRPPELGARRRERPERDAHDQGEHQRSEEGPSLELHRHRVPSVILSPASARRRRSPSRVSVRFSAWAAETSTAFFVVSIPRTRSWVRSRIARTSSSIVRAVASLYSRSPPMPAPLRKSDERSP